MKKHKKELIMRKAISYISRFGFDAVSIRQIGEAAGLSGTSIYNYFASKNDILDHILEYIYSEITVYSPSTEELALLLEIQSPEEILRRFFTYYDEHAGELWQELYRILYMQMYQDSRFLEAVYELTVTGPMNALESALRLLMEVGAIPAGDSRSLAEIWTRTSIVYAIENAHNLMLVDWEEYNAMQNFFLQIALRGVTPIPLEQMAFDWRIPFDQPAEPPRGTKEMILLSALELFSQYGYGNVSMREIAADVGIQAGSIYNHFSSKEAIIQNLIDRFLSGYERFTADNPAFLSLLRTNSSAQVVLYLASPYPPILTDQAYSMYRILFREHFINDQLEEFFFSSIAKDRHTIIRLLNSLAEEKRIAPCESLHIATAYVHTMVSLALSASVEYRNVDGSPLRPHTIALLVGLILNGYHYGPGEWAFDKGGR